MVKPYSVEKFGNDMLVRLDDGSRWRAIESVGNLYLVTAQVEEPIPPIPGGAAPFVWPFSLDLVTSEFGPRDGRLHAGIDFGNGIANVSGTDILCAGWGKVIVANTTNSHGGYGNAVVVDHGAGLHTLYGHMRFLPEGPADVSVYEGQTVLQGQRLGGVGKTGRSFGNHLHFETHEDGYRWDASARDPREFIPKWNQILAGV